MYMIVFSPQNAGTVHKSGGEEGHKSPAGMFPHYYLTWSLACHWTQSKSPYKIEKGGKKCVPVLSYAAVWKRVCSVLFLITSQRCRASSEETPTPIRAQLAGRSSRTVAKTRLSVTQMEADVRRHTQKTQTQSHCCKCLTHTLEGSVSGDFCESHCWCLSASTAIFLIILLSPQPGCIFRLFSSIFFPPYAPPALAHPTVVASSWTSMPCLISTRLVLPLAPAACWGVVANRQQIDSLPIYCYINVYGSLQTSEGRQLSLRPLINCLWCARE